MDENSETNVQMHAIYFLKLVSFCAMSLNRPLKDNVLVIRFSLTLLYSYLKNFMSSLQSHPQWVTYLYSVLFPTELTGLVTGIPVPGLRQLTVTMHVPHPPSPQLSLVPVNNRVSRRYETSLVSGGVSDPTSQTFPFTVNRTFPSLILKLIFSFFIHSYICTLN